jgi:hypothetical protein
MAGSIIDRRLRQLEDRLTARGSARNVFRFVDDSEGVERCRRENPDAFIIHRFILDAPVRAETGRSFNEMD